MNEYLQDQDRDVQRRADASATFRDYTAGLPPPTPTTQRDVEEVTMLSDAIRLEWTNLHREGETLVLEDPEDQAAALRRVSSQAT